MIGEINPYETTATKQMSKQTAEIRSGDGSADIYLYMAALIVAVQHGLAMKNAEEVAEKLYVGVNIFKEEHKKVREKLKQLPASCWDSAVCLEHKRKTFEANDIFPKGLIDSVIAKLKSHNDKNLSEKLYGKKDKIHELVMKYIDIM
jgi:glutamine synthetase